MKITMHRIIIVAGLFLIATSLNAQPELKVSNLKLTGDIARIYSSAIGAEFGYFFDFGDRIKFGATIGFFSSHPTKSSYPSYSIGSDQVTGGGDITFFPAEISYENLSIFPVGLNSFYQILDNKFSPYVSADILGYSGNYEISDISDVDLSGVGARMSAGVMLSSNNNWKFQLGLGKFMSFSIDGDKLQFWQYELGVMYEY